MTSLRILTASIGIVGLLGLGVGCAADAADDDAADDDAADDDAADDDAADDDATPPPDNAWPYGEIPDDFEAVDEDGDGVVDVGEYVPNFTFLDQNGDLVDLHQFYGFKLVLDFSAMWCPPCEDAAESAEEVYQELLAEGEPFLYLTVLIEDEMGRQPDQDDLQDWVQDYGITFPVLADDEYAAFIAFGGEALPTFILINRYMRVYDTEEGYAPSVDTWIMDSIRAMN